jgi:hypothetical protein
MKLIMAEYSEQGILAYVVHLGAIATDLAAGMPQEMMHILVDMLEIASHTIVWLVGEHREWLGRRYVSCQWDVDELLAKRQEIVDGESS